MTKIQFNFPLTLVRTTSQNVWQSLEVFGKLLEMYGSSWDAFRNSCHNRTKISSINKFINYFDSERVGKYIIIDMFVFV